MSFPGFERARRQNEWRAVREAIRRPQDEPPAPPSEKIAYAAGYVSSIAEQNNVIYVTLMGLAYGDGYDDYKPEFGIAFPPNKPEHLAELRRAQSSPHLRVVLHTREKEGNVMIIFLAIQLDYYAPPIENTPPFNTVKLEVAVPESASEPGSASPAP